MRLSARWLRRGVLPVSGPYGLIGTASVIGPGLALTALHVVAPQDPVTLRLGRDPGCPVAQVFTLPIHGYVGAIEPARRSQRRAQQLTGAGRYPVLDTVDLALLAVPDLPLCPALRPRGTGVREGEHLVVPGFPGGHWCVSQGPVVGHDDADFAVRMLLGPGASGSPALDRDHRLAGVVTLDHESATICVGPVLLTTFLGHNSRLTKQYLRCQYSAQLELSRFASTGAHPASSARSKGGTIDACGAH